MSRTVLTGAVAALMLVQPAPAQSAASSYVLDKIGSALDAKRGQKRPELFDGSMFTATASYGEADRYFSDFTKQLKVIDAAFGQLTSRDRSDARAKRYTADFRDRLAYQAAMAKAWPSFERAREAQALTASDASEAKRSAGESARELAYTLCKPFGGKESEGGIVAEVNAGSEKWSLQNAAEHKRWSDVLDGFADACSQEGFESFAAGESECLGGASGMNIKGICAAAADKDAILQRMADNRLLAITKKRAERSPSPKGLSRTDGWMTADANTPWNYKQLTSITDADRNHYRRWLQDLPTVESLRFNLGDPSIWRHERARKKALKTAIDDSASSYSLGAGFSHAAAAVAKSQAQREARRPKVVGSWAKRKGWQIHNNALGEPVRRSIGGHVLLKFQGEPHCQYRHWSYSEEHKGGGTYAKSSSVTFTSMRFQDCK